LAAFVAIGPKNCCSEISSFFGRTMSQASKAATAIRALVSARPNQQSH
jgi:hypothetical protein